MIFAFPHLVDPSSMDGRWISPYHTSWIFEDDDGTRAQGNVIGPMGRVPIRGRYRPIHGSPETSDQMYDTNLRLVKPVDYRTVRRIIHGDTSALPYYFLSIFFVCLLQTNPMIQGHAACSVNELSFLSCLFNFETRSPGFGFPNFSSTC